MPEIISYLEHGNGLVLHNGLPVKWVTNSGDLEFWGDYDIIIERYDCDIPGYNYNYKGFTVPYTGERLYYAPGYSRQATWYNNEEIIQTKAKAQWGTEIAEIDGDIKMKTTLNKNCDVVTRTGSWASFTATEPKVPSEERTTKAACYMYPQSAGNHYFFGVKFGNDFGVANAPDITNHGKPCSAGGYAVIHKLYAPNCVSLDYALNASNYSAIKNVYAPNVTNSAWTSAGVTLEVVGSPRRNEPDDAYGYTIGVPCYYDNWFVPNLDYWCPIEISHSGTSSFNITARNYRDLNSRIRNISARNSISVTACTADGTLTAPSISVSNMTLSADAKCTNFTGNNSTVNTISATNNVTLNGSTVNTDLSCINVLASNSKLNNVTANDLSAMHCSADNIQATTVHFSGFADSISGHTLRINASANIPVTVDVDGTLTASGLSNQSITAKNFSISVCNNLNLSASSGITVTNCHNITGKSTTFTVTANYTSANGNSVTGLNVTADNLYISQYSGGNYPPYSVPDAIGNFNVSTSADIGRGTRLNLTAGPNIRSIIASANVRIQRLYSDNLERVLEGPLWLSAGKYGAGWNSSLTAYGTYNLDYNNVIRVPENFSGNIDLTHVNFVGSAHETNIYTKTTTVGLQTVYLPAAASGRINYVYRSDGKSHYGNVQYV